MVFVDISHDFPLMAAVYFDRNVLNIFASIIGFNITDNVNKQGLCILKFVIQCQFQIFFTVFLSSEYSDILERYPLSDYVICLLIL